MSWNLVYVVVLMTMLAASDGHGPYTHPLTQFANVMHTISSSWSKSPPLPPMRLTSNCSSMKAPGVPLYCNVSWSGVMFPAEDDLVALYVPASADPTTTVPVQIAHAAASGPDHMTSGQGWAV